MLGAVGKTLGGRPVSATRLAAGCALLTLLGCTAQTQTVERPQGLADAPGLQAAPDEPGAWTYIAPGAQLSAYRRFILDPPRVFRGEGSSYGDLSDAEVQAIAQMFVEETRAALGTAYPVVTAAGAGRRAPALHPDRGVGDGPLRVDRDARDPDRRRDQPAQGRRRRAGDADRVGDLRDRGLRRAQRRAGRRGGA